MPVPASSTINHPDSVRTSMHGVLPPYRTVSAPGAGIEPRVPQKRKCKVMNEGPQRLALMMAEDGGHR
jgi:hypothetical protein